MTIEFGAQLAVGHAEAADDAPPLDHLARDARL